MDRSWTIDALWIAIAVILVLANGFFVAAEFALVKVRPTRLAHLARQNRAFAASAQWLVRRMDRSLSACQLGITMASLALGWVGEPAVAHLMEPAFEAAGITSPAFIHGLSFSVGFSIITAAHIVLGEQVPKIFAIRRPELLAVWSAVPLRAFYSLTYPLLRLLDGATGRILRGMGVDTGSDHEIPHGPEELRALAARSRTHGHLSRTEHLLVEAALDLDDTTCRQIMLPRTDVEFLDVQTDPEEMLRTIRRTLHTRYPVCRGSLDDVLGILHVKKLLGISIVEGFDPREYLSPPKYVPETMTMGRLLGHFQASRQHMALVVDEFGGVAGVVTLENVLEEIVGQVQDEFDAETAAIVQEEENVFLVRGGVSLDDVREMVGLDLADAEDVNTIAGLIVLRLGRIAASGDRVELEPGATAEVVEVRHNRASLIRLTGKLPREGADQNL